jgi:hypothetical protein
MNNEFKSIAEIINSSKELTHIKNLLEDKQIEKDFFYLFPELKTLVKSVKSSGKTLMIKVEIPALRTELKFRETEIIKKINDFYKSERINRLKFSTK